MRYTRFEDLPIWKEALALTKIVYDLAVKKSWSKNWFLKDQARRAVVSISSNIVEGFEKSYTNEFVRYLKISKGSVGELRNHMHISLTLGYTSESEFKIINSRLERLGNDIGAFIKYLQKYNKSNKNNP